MADQQRYRVIGITPETKKDFEALDVLTWFDEVDPDDGDLSGAIDLSRAFAATRTGEPPFSGIYAWYDHRLTVPAVGGGLVQVPCAGLTWVGVHPDDRRTGVLSTMLEHHLSSLHEAGVAFGALHASEVGIYGRFGYGQASFGVNLTVGGGTEVVAPGVDTTGIRTGLVDGFGDDAAARAVSMQHRVAAGLLGQVALTEQHLRRRFRRDARSERNSEPARMVVATRDGEDLGYVRFRRTQGWEDSLPSGTLEVLELVAAEPAVRLALVRRLLAFDLIGTVRLTAASVEDELVWWLGGPRAVKARVHDALWLRIVDVGAALPQRGYAADADVVLDVVDDRCPWNAGRWRFTASGGSASLARTEDAADVRLPVAALGSAFLGGRSVAAMARQGLVEELRPGTVVALSRAFATDVPPVAAAEF